MASLFNKIADPSGFFGDPEDRSTRSMFDPGSAFTGDKLNKITDPGNLLSGPAGPPPTTKPKTIGATAVRRPFEERLVTDFFAGVTGPTEAVADLRRRRLLTQKGIAATPGGISAAARALLVGDTGTIATKKLRDEAAAEERALAEAERLKKIRKRPGATSGQHGSGDFGGVGDFGFGGNPGAGTDAAGGGVGFA